MNKTDYLIKKGLLPPRELEGVFVYTFKSDKSGVTEISQRQVWDKHKCGNYFSYLDNGKEEKSVPMYRYILHNINANIKAEFPYEIDLAEDEIVKVDEYGGTGFGDLWGYSFFSSLNKEELEKRREEEAKRIKETYPNWRPEDEIWVVS